MASISTLSAITVQEEADLPRQHQASAAQRTPVHLLAHLDAAAGAGPCHRDLRAERRRDRRAPALHWVMMYLDEVCWDDERTSAVSELTLSLAETQAVHNGWNGP